MRKRLADHLLTSLQRCTVCRKNGYHTCRTGLHRGGPRQATVDLDALVVRRAAEHNHVRGPFGSQQLPGGRYIHSLSRSNNTLVPAGNAVTTLSPLSTLTSDRADLIFLCRNCVTPDGIPEILVSDAVVLTLFLSDAAPQFVSASSTQAVLPLDGAEQTAFVLDAAAARFSNFTALLHAAGFEV